MPIKGELWLDQGAQRAVLDRSQSLFSAGIKRVVGTFSAHDAVSLCTAEGKEFARGLCNYAHDEVERIKVCLSTAACVVEIRSSCWAGQDWRRSSA